jgi:hypothetical protein
MGEQMDERAYVRFDPTWGAALMVGEMLVETRFSAKVVHWNRIYILSADMSQKVAHLEILKEDSPNRAIFTFSISSHAWHEVTV